MADDERPPQPQPPPARVALPSAPRPRANNLSTGTGVFSPEGNANQQQQRQQQQPQQSRQPSFAVPPPPPRPPPPPPQRRTLVTSQPPRPPSSSTTVTASLPTLLATHPGSIIVSKRQEGNPLLKFLTNVRWVWGSEALSADYFLGPDAAALYLSLRFHLLKPQYVHARMAALAAAAGGGGSGGSGGGGGESGGGEGSGGNNSNGGGGGPRLKVLLTLVDVDDAEPALLDVNIAALRRGFTLICAFSAAEAARYLELIRAFESRPSNNADAIRGREGTDYLSRLNAALTSVRGVNKTDVLALGANFGSLAGVLSAPRQALSAVPGVGPTKARRLADAFHEPFFKTYNSGSAASGRTSTRERRTQARLVVGGEGGSSLRVAAPSAVSAAAAAAAAASAAAAAPSPSSGKRQRERGGGENGDGNEEEPTGDDDDFIALEGGAAPPAGGGAGGLTELEVEEIIEDDDDDVGLVID